MSGNGQGCLHAMRRRAFDSKADVASETRLVPCIFIRKTNAVFPDVRYADRIGINDFAGGSRERVLRDRSRGRGT